MEQRPHLCELLREGAQVQLLTQGLFLSSCLPVLGTAFKSLVNCLVPLELGRGLLMDLGNLAPESAVGPHGRAIQVEWEP